MSKDAKQMEFLLWLHVHIYSCSRCLHSRYHIPSYLILYFCNYHYNQMWFDKRFMVHFWWLQEVPICLGICFLSVRRHCQSQKQHKQLKVFIEYHVWTLKAPLEFYFPEVSEMWAGTHFLVAQKHVVPWIIRFVWLKLLVQVSQNGHGEHYNLIQQLLVNYVSDLTWFCVTCISLYTLLCHWDTELCSLNVDEMKDHFFNV